jgi:hypothetical protein
MNVNGKATVWKNLVRLEPDDCRQAGKQAVYLLEATDFRNLVIFSQILSQILAAFSVRILESELLVC